MLHYSRVNKAHTYADASVFTIEQVSVGSVTPERNWASQKFGWFPSESHPVGLSFWKNLWCLFATQLALLSLQSVFCSPTVWFIASVVVIFGLALLKLSLAQRELTKHRNLVTCSQYCAEGSNAISQLISSSSASVSEKTLVHPFISRKPTFPVCMLPVLLRSSHCHANNPARHHRHWTHPHKVSGCNTPLFTHIWSLVESAAQNIWG